jgi:hypothetical protein
MAVELGNALHKGEKPAETTIKATPQFITRENLAHYHGWTGGDSAGDAGHTP